jgi:hypothetical protein
LTGVVSFWQWTEDNMSAIGKQTVMAVTAFLLIGTASAHAQISLVTTRSALAGTDFIDWGTLGPTRTIVSNPFTILSNGGISVNVSKESDTSSFERLDVGSGWAGGFSPGDQLLFTGPDLFGDITLDFGTPVTAFGANIEADFFGDFIAELAFFDASNALIGVVTENGTATEVADGSAIFIGGVSGSSATDFFRVSFCLLEATDCRGCFAINQPDFSLAAVPEPTSLALAGMGIAGALGYFWQRQRKLRQKL